MRMTLNQKLDHFEHSVRHDVIAAAKNALAQNPPFLLGAVRLLAVYFEIIGKYVRGFDSAGKSEQYFKQGCREVIKVARGTGTDVHDRDLEHSYELARCSSYHGAVPSFNVK